MARKRAAGGWGSRAQKLGRSAQPRLDLAPFAADRAVGRKSGKTRIETRWNRRLSYPDEMSSRTRCLRLVALTTVTTGVLALVSLAAGEEPSEAAKGGPQVTIKTTPKRGITLGDSGSVRVDVRTAAGTPYTLDIYEIPFPYKREKLLDSFDFTATSGAEYEVRPKFNTRYRAEIRGQPETSTKRKALWVYQRRGGVRIKVHRHGRVTSKMFLDYSPKLPYDLDRRPLFFYFREKGTNRWIPKERTRTRVVSPGHVRGRAKFRIPTDHRYRFYVTWCFETKDRDIGIGRPVKPTCPHRPVRDGFLKAPAFGQSPAFAGVGLQPG